MLSGSLLMVLGCCWQFCCYWQLSSLKLKPASNPISRTLGTLHFYLYIYFFYFFLILLFFLFFKIFFVFANTFFIGSWERWLKISLSSNHIINNGLYWGFFEGDCLFYSLPSLPPSNCTEKSINELYKLPLLNVVFFCVACKPLGSGILW